MYNSDIPSRAELPTSAQLLRSTVIAMAAAAAILVTIVLPAEYAIDPTGVGRLLGLTEMGEIKAQLAEEAEQDRMRDQQNVTPPAPTDRQSRLFGGVFSSLFVASAAAEESIRSDEMTVSLKPGEGTEIKLVMRKGAKVQYSWTANGGAVNFDMHGDGGGQSTSYEKGRAVPGADGVLEAAFDGNHGWFWRNRTKAEVTVTLKTSGDYSEIKRLL